MPGTMTPTPASPNSTSPLYITQITLPSGNTYELVDENARITITSVSSNINSISSNINSVSSTVNSLSSTVNSLSSTINGLSNATQFLGITTSEITDGTTTAIVNIKTGENSTTAVTATAGDIVIKTTGSSTAGKIAQEYIYDGSHWQLFGDISANNLGALAYKDSASGTVTTTGTINTGTATLTSSGKYTKVNSVTLTKTEVAFGLKSVASVQGISDTSNYWKYTPTGTVTVDPTLTTTSAEVLIGITQQNVVQSITALEPNSDVANTVAYATVTGNTLKLSRIKPTSGQAVSGTSTTGVIQAVKSITATAQFGGTDIYVKPLSVTVATAVGYGTENGTVSVTGAVINSVTFTGKSTTVTVS